ADRDLERVLLEGVLGARADRGRDDGEERDRADEMRRLHRRWPPGPRLCRDVNKNGARRESAPVMLGATCPLKSLRFSSWLCSASARCLPATRTFASRLSAKDAARHHSISPPRRNDGGQKEHSRSQLPPDPAIERIRPAAAQRDRQHDQAPQQDIFV